MYEKNGESAEQIAATALGELPPGPETRRCVQLRAHLGISSAPDAPAFVLPSGEALTTRGLGRWLRMARLVRTSLEANGGICRSLLEVRYDRAKEREEVSR